MTDGASVIASDMVVRGECHVEGVLRIGGRVAGNVVAGALELAASGSIDGDVVQKDATRTEAPSRKAEFIVGGAVTGTVRADRVEVRRGGSVLRGVVADEATVEGHVAGGVRASSRVAIREGAYVEGDVQTPRLSLEEGGRMTGSVCVGDPVDIEDSGVSAAEAPEPSTSPVRPAEVHSS